MSGLLQNFNKKIMSGVICRTYILGLIVLTGCINACSVKQIHKGQLVSKEASWVLLPVVNLAEVPQAGERVESVIETFLYSRGIRSLSYYPRQTGEEEILLLDDRARYRKALEWAKKQGFKYAITGSVEEWRYKSGLDGEPAVGLSLRIIDMKSGKVIWSASGAKTGWGYDSVSGVAISLINKLLDGIDIE